MGLWNFGGVPIISSGITLGVLIIKGPFSIKEPVPLNLLLWQSTDYQSPCS